MASTRYKKTTTRHWGETLTTEEQVEAKKRFLEHYATEEPIIERACIAANVSRTTYHRWMEHDAEFAMVLEQAKYAGDDLIRAEIHRRGLIGYDEPVFYQGEQVATVRKYSDACLLKLAASRMPEFRDKQSSDQTDQAPIKAYVGVNLEEV